MSRRLLEVAREGVLHVVRHPLRTALSAATCAIAIAVTVNVISLVYGMDADIRQDVSRFGRLTVDVGRFPTLLPAAKREPLGEAEVAAIREQLSDLRAVVVPRRQAVGSAAGTGRLSAASVVAVSPEYLRTLDVALVAGRWLRASDGPAAACVLDRSAAADLFPGVEPARVLGRTVEIELAGGKVAPTVVGVLEDPMTYRTLFEQFDEGRGSRTLTSALLSFRNVYVPEGALPGGEVSGVSIRLPTEAAVDEAAKRLRERWPASDQDPLRPRGTVGVFVRRDWMSAIGATTQTGALLGNLVWIIVVGVAVIMISTLNLITIRERYDEIAIRRCEGARRRDVALQVTVEGSLTALLGGLVGLPIGYLGAEVLRGIVGFPFRFEARYAAVATLVAIGLGLLASVVPARRAARLQPAGVLTRRLT